MGGIIKGERLRKEKFDTKIHNEKHQFAKNGQKQHDEYVQEEINQ